MATQKIETLLNPQGLGLILVDFAMLPNCNQPIQRCQFWRKQELGQVKDEEAQKSELENQSRKPSGVEDRHQAMDLNRLRVAIFNIYSISHYHV